jgi:PAS domain-containing protein
MEEHSLSLKQFDEFDFRELPIGVYLISLDGQFIVANKIVRKMLEFPLDGRLNANIKDYYVNAADWNAAIEEVKKLTRQGKNVERGILHLKVGERELHVEDYSKSLQNADGQVVGFVGCMVDVTSDFESKLRERELQERVEELRFDIGRILHANTTTLVMVQQTL